MSERRAVLQAAAVLTSLGVALSGLLVYAGYHYVATLLVAAIMAAIMALSTGYSF